MKKYRFIAPVLAAVVMVWATGMLSRAQADSKAERSSLTGLKGVHVVVERIDPQLNSEILDTKSVERDIEATLAAGGVRVLGEEEMLGTPGMPYLYVNLSTAKSGLVYAYHIQLEARQGAFLERDPNVVVTSTTWSGKGMTGMVAISEVNMIRTFLEDAVAEFVKAYIAANPPAKAR